MSAIIRKMTKGEFASFYQWSIENYAKELMDERHISYEKAMKAAEEEVAQMLPDGMHTEHNHFATIVADDENAGFIWTIHEKSEGRKQCFICDFTVWESMRRKGYASTALYLTEKNAAEAGCRESVLFVREDNTAARALYQKCGYQVLRQAGYGKYMIKQLL